jgi:type I restriction enzyme S subunit
MTRNWGKSSLAGLCTYFGDGDWIESKDQSSSGVRLVQTGNVGQGEFKDRAEKARYVSEETFTRLRCTEIFAGDCLISRLPDPPGRACLIPSLDERLITAVDCSIVRFDHDKILPEYFVYYAQTGEYLAAVEREATGTTRKRISRARLGQVPVPIAPLAEQRRIVTILDEAFEGIATAKAHAEQNLRNALDLFASTLDACLVETGPDSVETTLGAEASLLAGYAFSSAGYTDDPDGIRLLRGDNIMQGYLRWDEVKRWPSIDADVHQRFTLQSGDVVLAMDRPWVKAGLKRAQITDDDLPCLQVQRTARLRPLPALRSDFLYFLTGSQSFSQYLLAAQTGSGVPHISGKQIEGFAFHRPPVKEQVRMAQKLRMVEEQCQQLASVYQRKLTALTELQQSLLHQAFTGQF